MSTKARINLFQYQSLREEAEKIYQSGNFINL